MIKACWFQLLILFLVATPAAGLETSFGGFLKNFDIYRQSPPESNLDSGWFAANRLRLETELTFDSSWQLQLAAEDLLLYTHPPGLVSLPDDNINRRIDLEHDWNRDGRFADQLQIDRLQLNWQQRSNELKIGRQAIGFGRIVIFSPLDVIAPFSPDAIDTEVRPGVDALRVAHYFGMGGEVSGNLVFGQEKDLNSYLITASHNLSGIDLLGIAGVLRQREMIGIGAAGNIGGLGLKGEISSYRGKNVGQPGGDLHDDFAIGAVELWYRFANDLVLLGQYLYNGPGVGDPADYLQAVGSAPLREGLTYLVGHHYLTLAPSYDIHPLVNLQGLLIWNLEDDSWQLRPLIDMSLSDNLELQLFWTFFAGKEPQASSLSPLPVPRSEFGSAGDAGGLFLAYHF